MHGVYLKDSNNRGRGTHKREWTNKAKNALFVTFYPYRPRTLKSFLSKNIKRGSWWSDSSRCFTKCDCIWGSNIIHGGSNIITGLHLLFTLFTVQQILVVSAGLIFFDNLHLSILYILRMWQSCHPSTWNFDENNLNVWNTYLWYNVTILNKNVATLTL